jgi:hypothetical protein
MPGRVRLKNAIYALLVPINRRYAPTLEKIRRISVPALFDTVTANKRIPYIKPRFEGDEVGEIDGVDIDPTEIGVVGLRIFDLINKTELKCYFKSSIEWYEDYALEGTRRIKYVTALANSFKDEISQKAKKEMIALEIPEPTAVSILSYFEDEDPVNRSAGLCALLLVSCLASAANQSLFWYTDRY